MASERYPFKANMSPYFLKGKSRMEWGHDEERLVWAAQIGDLAAFNELVRRYRPAATMTARSILENPEMAEDAVQDSFVLAYKSLPKLGEASRFGGWLGAIVRHRSIRLRAGERRVHLPIDDLIVSHVPSIQAELEVEERNEALRCALSKVTDEIRQVLALYYLHDWSVRDIAEYLNTPETTVKWRLHSGRRQLRDLLIDEESEPI